MCLHAHISSCIKDYQYTFDRPYIIKTIQASNDIRLFTKKNRLISKADPIKTNIYETHWFLD